MKKEPIRTYIASPYSPTTKFQKLPIIASIVRYFRERQVTKIAAHLLETMNIAPICPITQSRRLAVFMKNKNGEFKTWKEIDFSYINGCSQVFVIMMNGWKESTGVQAEIKYAKRKKILIRYFEVLPSNLIVEETIEE